MTRPIDPSLQRIRATPGELTTHTAARAIAAAVPGVPVVMVHNDREVLVRHGDTPEGVHRAWNAAPDVASVKVTEHRLQSPPHPRACTCGWEPPLGESVMRAFDRHLIEVADTGPWRDRHGDVWTLGDDGLLHTPETAPFPREHVERKWGPLRTVPAASLVLTAHQALDKAAADLGVVPLPWQRDFVLCCLNGAPATLLHGRRVGRSTALRLAERADRYYTGGTRP